MPIQTLDYTAAKIVMKIENQVEQEYRIKACAKEPWTIAFIESIPRGEWFVDVGANVGPYTLVAISRGVRALALEPAPANFARLWENLCLNAFADHALIKCVAAGPAAAWNWLHFQDTRPGGASHTFGPDLKIHHHRSMVPTETLDALVEPLAGDMWVKIDVDGCELMVLHGATKLLAAERLKGLLIEINRENEASVLEYVQQHGWKGVQRFDHRGDSEIGHVVYWLFQRG